MKQLKYLLLVSVWLGLMACQSIPGQGQGEPAVNASERDIQAHMEFLASDLMRGRDTGSQEHEIASHYIAQEFFRLGLAPAGTAGYMQRVPLRQAQLAGEPEFIVHGAEGDQGLAYPEVFFTAANASELEQELTAPMVFVGYGLVSEEFGIDDYADLDVAGKIVVMLTGRPDHLPSEEAAHLNRQKNQFAIDRGAVGVITIHTPQREETRPFEVASRFADSPRLRWLTDEGHAHGDEPQIQGGAYLHYEAAEALFEGASTGLEQVLAQLDEGQEPAGFTLEPEVTLRRQAEHQELDSPNVIGMLPGSDPELRDEFVIYTAHSDHLGYTETEEGLQIYNGALDNAAGVAVLLDTARMFAEQAAAGHGPKRSVIFAAVTAEERGLLGADYFAHNPTVELENIVANVNLDMPVLLYPFADIIAFGAAHSSLGDVVEAAAAEHDIGLSPDPMPEQAIFTRSDHYTLVRQGVPAVFLMTGFDSQDPEQDGGEVWGQFFAEQYHQAGDSLEVLEAEYGAIRYDFGALFADINFAIGMRIANAAERPYWLPESYFSSALPAVRAD